MSTAKFIPTILLVISITSTSASAESPPDPRWDVCQQLSVNTQDTSGAQNSEEAEKFNTWRKRFHYLALVESKISAMSATQVLAPPAEGSQEAKCEAFLRENAAFRKAVVESLWADYHDRHSRRQMTDWKHVWVTYVIIWLLSVAFIGFLWRKQSRHRAELSQLKAQVKTLLDSDK